MDLTFRLTMEIDKIVTKTQRKNEETDMKQEMIRTMTTKISQMVIQVKLEKSMIPKTKEPPNQNEIGRAHV